MRKEEWWGREDIYRWGDTCRYRCDGGEIHVNLLFLKSYGECREVDFGGI